MAKNQVVAGDYVGCSLMVLGGCAQFKTPRGETVMLDKVEVESFEVVTEETQKSAASGVARGLVGGALLGPVGMLAGALSAKDKSTYHLAVAFKNGKRSLMEVDAKTYKAIMTLCF